MTLIKLTDHRSKACTKQNVQRQSGKKKKIFLSLLFIDTKRKDKRRITLIGSDLLVEEKHRVKNKKHVHTESFSVKKKKEYLSARIVE